MSVILSRKEASHNLPRRDLISANFVIGRVGRRVSIKTRQLRFTAVDLAHTLVILVMLVQARFRVADGSPQQAWIQTARR